MNHFYFKHEIFMVVVIVCETIYVQFCLILLHTHDCEHQVFWKSCVVLSLDIYYTFHFMTGLRHKRF
jgi:hypothetical protein